MTAVDGGILRGVTEGGSLCPALVSWPGSFGFLVSGMVGDFPFFFLSFAFMMILSWVSVLLLLAFQGGIIAGSVTDGVAFCPVCSFNTALAVLCSTVWHW